MVVTHIDSFWEGLSALGVVEASNVIMGGNLNFTFSLREVKGKHPHRDPQEFFFSHWITGNHMVDLEPTKNYHTWRNDRKWEKIVAKRLDRFLFMKNFF